MSRKRKRKKKQDGGAARTDDEAATTTKASESKTAAQAQGAAPRRRPSPTGYDWWRENLEAIIVAFILALIIRHFSVEAFEIPTGSMAPTLYGVHAWATCPNCDTRLDMGLETDPVTQQIKPSNYQRLQVYRGACEHCGMPHNRAHEEFAGGQVVFLRRQENLRPGISAFKCTAPGCEHIWTGAERDYTREFIHQNSTASRGDILLTCPTCQFRFKDVIARSNAHGGHKILVNKFAYRIGKPRRWDVIVFHFDEEKNYIKRLLALPGETAWIQGGDLYIEGPGERPRRVARKIDRPDVRDSLWIEIANSAVREKGYNRRSAWREIYEKGSGIDVDVKSKWWTWDTKTLRWVANVLRPAGRVACLGFNRRSESFYDYNLLRNVSPDHEVGDKKVTFTVRPSQANAGGWIGGEIREKDFTYQFRLPVGTAAGKSLATLRRLETEPDPENPSPGRRATGEEVSAPVTLPLKKASRVEFENVDDRVAVIVDGEEVLVIEYESGSPRLAPDEHSLMILASGVSADFESMRVYRDIYYTSPGNLHSVYGATGTGGQRIGLKDVGSQNSGGGNSGSGNEYFPCGDNSPSSSDGRFWGTVPEHSMMGKAFVVFWPAVPVWNWQGKFIH